MKSTIPAICLLISVACAQNAVETDKLRTRSQHTGICPLHHVPMVHGVAYDIVLPPRTTIDLGNDQATLWEKYPNAIYPIYQRHRSGDYRRPVSVTYCPVCQQLYEREWTKQH